MSYAGAPGAPWNLGLKTDCGLAQGQPPEAMSWARPELTQAKDTFVLLPPRGGDFAKCPGHSLHTPGKVTA